MKEELDKKALVALQRGLPLEPGPFHLLAEGLGCTEDELLERVDIWRKAGVIRRVGGVFNSRCMGFRSVLCACSNKTGIELADLAEKLQSISGVTHCYEREPMSMQQKGIFDIPRLWFTFLAEERKFEEELAELCMRLGEQPVHVLPAGHRFKTQVILGARHNAPAQKKQVKPFPCREVSRVTCPEGEESRCNGPRCTQGPPGPGGPTQSNMRVETSWHWEPSALPPLTERQRDIVALLQGNIPVTPSLWASLAKGLGIQSLDLLSDMRELQDQGRLKRVAAVLHHQQAGWRANAMALWRVQETDVGRSGQALAAQPEVTHCYERPPFPGFPYNLYAMMHAPDWEELDGLARRIAKTAQLPPPFLLASRREFIKRSPRYVPGRGQPSNEADGRATLSSRNAG